MPFFSPFSRLMYEFPAIGMMFLYRRNRRAVLDPTEDVNGIRINIPLSRIATISKTQSIGFAWMVSITIGADHLASNGAAVTPPAENDSQSVSDGTLSEVLSQDSETEPYVVQFAAVRKDPVWEDVMSYVEKAKAAMTTDPTEWAGSNVYIDFDPRADEEEEESEGNGLSGVQKSVSHTLGLDPTKEFYSEWRCPSLRHESKEHISVGSAHTHRRIITHKGYFAVNAECIGFWSRSITFGRDVRYRIPIARVKGIKGQERCRFSKEHSLVIEVQGRRDLHIHFSAVKKCDAALAQTNRFIELARERGRDTTLVTSPISESPPLVESPTALTPQRVASADNVNTSAGTAPVTATSSRSRPASRSSSPTTSRSPMRSVSSILAPLSRLPSTVQRTRNANIVRALFPKAINVPDGVLLPMPSKHFVCLTIGSRGDVQPYIALGKALQAEGHKVTIVTHEEYKEWVTGFGIAHRTAGGDPGALMKLSVENKVSSTFIIPVRC
jgi:sterol 3beta-glucosyltransferase